MTASADALAAAPSREPSRHSTTTRIVIYGLQIVFAIPKPEVCQTPAIATQ
jgi:hypothetical protein